MRQEVGPQGSGDLDAALTRLAQVHNDTEVRRVLSGPDRREMVLDANTGEPVVNHVYRLDCGHLISVWLTPLPEGTTFQFCGEPDCREQRRVVEHLT